MENKTDYKGHAIVKGYFILFGIGLSFILGIAMCAGGATPEQKAKNAERDRQLDAYVYAQEFVKKRLPVPNSADFPAQNEAIIKYCNNDMYYVEGYFDAQNRYGANVRWKYHCMVHLERGQAESSEVVVEEP